MLWVIESEGYSRMSNSLVRIEAEHILHRREDQKIEYFW
jgi:hypothetical protein